MSFYGIGKKFIQSVNEGGEDNDLFVKTMVKAMPAKDFFPPGLRHGPVF
jgi:hypothetical protein